MTLLRNEVHAIHIRTLLGTGRTQGEQNTTDLLKGLTQGIFDTEVIPEPSFQKRERFYRITHGQKGKNDRIHTALMTSGQSADALTFYHIPLRQ